MFAYVSVSRYVRVVKSYAKDDTGSCAANRFRRSTKNLDKSDTTMSGNDGVYSSNELQGPSCNAEEEFLLKTNKPQKQYKKPPYRELKVFRLKCATAVYKKNTRTG